MGPIPLLTPLQCQDIPVPALHAYTSLGEARGCSGALMMPGSLIEDLFEGKITQGLFLGGLLVSLLLNTNCIQTYSPVLQVILPREHFTLPVTKNTLLSVCPSKLLPSPLNSKTTSFSFRLVPL